MHGLNDMSQATWSGWCWTEKGWEKVCSAPTLYRCGDLLEQAGQRLNVPTHLQILTTGAAPTFTPKRADSLAPGDER
jgi:hypothetical protein